MNERQKEILAFLINEYIKSAQPVGSHLLTEKSGLDLSSATFRNELAVLEEEGFLEQPHTSSGRVPTEKAYNYYVETFLTKKEFDTSDTQSFKLALKKEFDGDSVLKSVAKELVAKSQQAVIVAFDKQNVYYTGLSQLFAQPEFASQDDIVSLSSVVDRLDDVIDKVFDDIDDIQILIGSSNPFGNACSAIVGKYTFKNGKEGMFAILGPMRMDYKKNFKLMGEVKQLVERINESN